MVNKYKAIVLEKVDYMNALDEAERQLRSQLLATKATRLLVRMLRRNITRIEKFERMTAEQKALERPMSDVA